MSTTNEVTLKELVERKTQAYRRQLEGAVQSLRDDPAFRLLFGDDGVAELISILPAADSKPTVPKARTARARKVPKTKKAKSDFAEKRGSRGDSIRQVIKNAGRWLTAREIYEALPGIGYAAQWGNPGANVRAVIQEDRRLGVTRLVLRDAKFGLAEWADYYPEVGPK